MEEINLINRQILNTIKDYSSLEIVNAIMSKLVSLNDFTKIAQDNYNSEILPLRNVNQVNKWCDKKTHGKIKKIINEWNPNTFMIIINAVYFKGEWLNKFEKESTKKQIFYNLNKNEKKIDMMEITDHYNYFLKIQI